jgi:hypothetical protein
MKTNFLDGYDYSLNFSPLWRKSTRGFNKTYYNTCFGVDLNRNFDAGKRIGSLNLT